MNTQLTVIDYDTYECRHSSAHSRQCIDGTITGSGKCVAFCEYEQHPGFLTDELRADHNCLEKSCIYYLQKKNRVRSNRSVNDLEHDHIMEVSRRATSDMEGMRLMRADRDADGGWTIYYISIADYVLDSIVCHLEEMTGSSIRFSNLDYRFEIAAELIFGVKAL